MGQLEKYGLYVMCLVIFLILGVTLWGDPANASKTKQKKEAAINASLDGEGGQLQGAPFNDRSQRRSPALDELLGPAERPPKASENPSPRRDAPMGGGRLGEILIGGQPTKEPKVDPAPTPKPKTEPARKRVRYKVRKGDSFARIAKRELGSEKYTTLIAKLNRGVNASKLQIGQELVLPTSEELGGSPRKSANKAVASGAYRTYTVSKGDSFERIARVELGSLKRVKELRQMNANVNPRTMQIGQEIKLPLK